MATLGIEGEKLTVGLSALEALGALRRSFSVPLSAVREVRWVADPLRQVRGMRVPGTGVPGVIALGSWRGRFGRDFVAAYRRSGVVVELEGQPDRRLVMSCDPSARVRAVLDGFTRGH